MPNDDLVRSAPERRRRLAAHDLTRRVFPLRAARGRQYEAAPTAGRSLEPRVGCVDGSREAPVHTVSYQSNFAPNRMIVGPMMLTGRRNAPPLFQVMFWAASELVML